MTVSPDFLVAVRTSSLLSEFDDAELAGLAKQMDLVEFQKGEHIFEQDTQGGPLFLLLSGQVGVMRKLAPDANSRKDRERLLAVVSTGECIGEMALADGGPRSATVVALEPVQALALTAENYEAMREADPKLAIKMALGVFRLLSKRLRQINKSLEIVHYWMFA